MCNVCLNLSNWSKRRIQLPFTVQFDKFSGSCNSIQQL